MMVFLELLIIWFVVATVIYIAVAIYSRSVQRERLEKEYDATDPQGGDVARDRDTYVQDGLADYEHGLRRRLIGLIYVVPVVLFAIVIYMVNYR